MGRHSRRGPAPKGNPPKGVPADAAARPEQRAAPHPQPAPGAVPRERTAPPGSGTPSGPAVYGDPVYRLAPPRRRDPRPGGTPPHGAAFPPGAPGGLSDATPVRGVPRYDTTPPQGVPQFPRTPRLPHEFPAASPARHDGTPPHGMPYVGGQMPPWQEAPHRPYEDTPPQGVPRFGDRGATAHGVPHSGEPGPGFPGAGPGGPAGGPGGAPGMPPGGAHGPRPGAPQGVRPGGPRNARPGAPQGAAGGSGLPEATPAHGTPVVFGSGPFGFADGTPARGVPQVSFDGTPPHGIRRFPDGLPPRGAAQHAGGPHGDAGLGGQGPAQGVSRHTVPPPGAPTPGRAAPGLPDGTPPHGAPPVRGGHPEQREPGGAPAGAPAAVSGAAPGVAPAGARPAPPAPTADAPARGPRQEYVDAFAENTSAPASGTGPGRRTGPDDDAAPDDPRALAEQRGGDDGTPTEPRPGAQGDTPGAGKGRTYTGIMAAAVLTVLAVVVAGQVADRGDKDGVRTQAATDQARHARDVPAGSGPSASASAEPTYEEKMGRLYELSPNLTATGEFDAVEGIAKGTGKGRKYTYRVDIERGLGLDGELFAEAVHRTLNDDRSWAHNGARTFERIHSGRPDFVITLASPGTTAEWCARSGLDTTVDNVSCDSAATDRVMINAYRWARGSETYGDARIHAYRQMLINHEVGHRLGHYHVTCDKDGDLAPVMQQQTKFLTHDGITCKPNPWPYPNED